MDFATLGNWLWEAACTVRGPLDAPKYKDYILPLLFYKRICDVFDDELSRIAQELGDRDFARQMAEADRGLVRFYIPPDCMWREVRRQTRDLGERLTDALKGIARENSRLDGILDRRDFNATEAGMRILEDAVLARLMEVLNRQRLGLADVEPDILGRAYEYLLRKFAEGSGQSAGEFFTPTEVGFLMAHILDPEEGDSIYDPCCGSGGLLIKSQLRLREKIAARLSVDVHDLKPQDLGRGLRLYGQEISMDTWVMAEINAFTHDMSVVLERGDTMHAPRFVADDGGLMRFDRVVANPMWNQNFPAEVYENDPFKRFERGTPPASSADWGWIQHMAASLNDPAPAGGTRAGRSGGKMAVVLDTGAVSRGSGNQGSNKERDLRKGFVDQDWAEAVILLPENLFFNTSAPGIILVINKARRHAGEILLINASKLCEKGRPKNFLTDEHIAQIFALYRDWRAEDGLSAVITREEAARNDYNLSPGRYVASNDVEPPLPLEEALVLLAEAEEERAAADRELDEVLAALGFVGWRNA